MSVAVALWSLALVPGKTEVLIPQSDLRITNAALGDELADSNGRTSVKLVYNTPVKMDDGSDNEEAPDPVSTTILCSLTAGKIEQATIDLVLEEDDEYIFEVVGKNTIYLTGNYIDQSPPDQVPYNDESDSEDEGAFDLEDVSSDVEMDPNELEIDSDDEGRFEEITESLEKSLKRPRASDVSEVSVKADKKSKKQKAEDGQAVPVAKAEEKKEKKDKKAKKDENPEAKPAAKAAATKELPSGLKYTDTTVGTGPLAKKGNTISMRYIGKLQNGSVFDKNVKGKPFTFHLGKGEVIKGWDEGIVGMAVGGERLLTIPANLAYGNKKMDGIPAKSTLIFECKLIEIK